MPRLVKRLRLRATLSAQRIATRGPSSTFTSGCSRKSPAQGMAQRAAAGAGASSAIPWRSDGGRPCSSAMAPAKPVTD